MSGQTVADGMLFASYRFTFDHVYDQDSSQDEVYSQSAKQVVLSTLQASAFLWGRGGGWANSSGRTVSGGAAPAQPAAAGGQCLKGRRPASQQQRAGSAR